MFEEGNSWQAQEDLSDKEKYQFSLLMRILFQLRGEPFIKTRNRSHHLREILFSSMTRKVIFLKPENFLDVLSVFFTTHSIFFFLIQPTINSFQII